MLYETKSPITEHDVAAIDDLFKFLSSVELGELLTCKSSYGNPFPGSSLHFEYHTSTLSSQPWGLDCISLFVCLFCFVCRPTGPQDVRLNILYCGICHTDLHQIKNQLQESVYPMIPG
jgi:hypothetical protein